MLRVVQPPEWLSGRPLDRPLPVHAVLAGSVYYPGSGTDGDPIKHLGGYFWSFVYADYGYTPEAVREALRAGAFGSHLRLIGHRALTEAELPLTRWNEETRGQFAYGRPVGNNAPPFYRRGRCPFAEWALLEDPAGRPRRIFSLLFVGADGVTFFEKAYVERGLAPACICIIQAPPAMGGFNWTNFEDERGPLYQTVKTNPAGLPRYLLYGGGGDPNWYNKPCWPAYGRRLAWPLLRVRDGRPEGALGLWEITAAKEA